MDLQQLRYVAALAQEKHFQRAAKSVGITQPTLSQQVKKLEEELGEPLFERSSRRVALTPAGERFLPHVLAALDALKKGMSAIQEEGDLSEIPVRVGFLPTMGPYLIPEILNDLKERVPELKLEFHEDTAEALVHRVREGGLNLGVLSLPVHENGIAARSLGHEPVYVAVSPTHALAGCKNVPLRRLHQEPLFVLREGRCLRDQMLVHMKRAKAQPRIAFQGTHLTSLLKMAATGEGVAIVPKMAVESHSGDGLRFLPFANPQPTREIGVIWRRSAALTQREHLVMRAIESRL